MQLTMATITRWCVASLLFVSVLHAAESSNIDPLDWPYWRGPEMNGVSRETGLVDKWSPSGDNVLWKSEELGGRSTPIVMRGKLYTLTRHHPGTPTEAEKVVCVDAATGKKIWENVFNVYLSDVPDTRVAWSSVVGDPTTGNVFALGVAGYFQCINGETGETIWSHSMSEEHGLLTTYGGRTNFPIVFDDLVIISGVMIGWGENAKPNHRFIAYNKSNGQVVWFNATRPLPDDTTYSGPVIGVFDGQALMLVGAGDGSLYAMQPRTGKIVWKYDMSRRGVNMTPLIVDDKVVMCQSEENPTGNKMGMVALIKGTGSGDITENGAIWKNEEWMVGRAAPLNIDGKLLLIDDGAGLMLADLMTGKLLFKQKLGTMQRVSPLYADGKVYTSDANGRWNILKVAGDNVKSIHRLRLAGEVHASPIVSHGRLYVTTTEAMYCIGKKDTEVSATPRPEYPQEADVASDPTPQHVQIVPAESLVRPGARIKFETRVFNARGQRLEGASSSYEVAGMGTINGEGEYAVPEEKSHHAVSITATNGKMKSVGLVRVVPDLPWSFDFADKEIPITWVGARYRHVIREVDGNPMMVKITTIPKGTRSQSWMGHPDLHDYTVQADVRGSVTNSKMPDMGVIAQRYTFDMMGASQQLQIRTWPPVLRMAKTMPFTWRPEVWYTMKFQASNEGDKAVLRGKVWERGQPEPAEWTLEATDESPNRTGSPGLFGNATNAEVFIDNIKVTPNAK